MVIPTEALQQQHQQSVHRQVLKPVTCIWSLGDN